MCCIAFVSKVGAACVRTSLTRIPYLRLFSFSLVSAKCSVDKLTVVGWRVLCLGGLLGVPCGYGGGLYAEVALLCRTTIVRDRRQNGVRASGSTSQNGGRVLFLVFAEVVQTIHGRARGRGRRALQSMG